jgi:hypothetical protein
MNQPIIATISGATGADDSGEYLYFVSWSRPGGQFGNCYLELTRPVHTRADVYQLRDDLHERGLSDAVVLSFTLLPGGWGNR